MNRELSSCSEEAVQAITAAINQRLKGRTRPLVVSLDGGSGAGKSTLAAEVAACLQATVIQCDDFFDATVSDEEWGRCTPEQKCRRCIDWTRLRREALQPLLAGEPVRYRPFSFSTETRLAEHEVAKEPAAVIILDGIYSSLPELADVLDFTVLVQVTTDVRRLRHNLREGSEDVQWHLMWDSAEDFYFGVLRPPASFDLIVVNP